MTLTNTEPPYEEHAQYIKFINYSVSLLLLLQASVLCFHLILLHGCQIHRKPKHLIDDKTMNLDAADLDAMRKASFNRAKNNWQALIKRLSSLSENEQGDIIDLRTGQIIKDTGHLRSLKETKDSLWSDFNSKNTNKSNDEHVKSIKPAKPVDKITKLRPDNTPKYNNIPIIDLSLSPKNKSNKKHSQPGDNSYIVSFSQHMTRSKVVGDDNLVVGTGHSTPIASTTSMKRKKRPYPLNDNTNDPLNLLNTDIDLGTPSKVRRLRKAIDLSYSLSKKRRHLHKLILHSKSGIK